MAQYAHKQVKKIGIPYKPTAASKMRLTSSEKSKIACHVHKARQSFEETQNKPHRGDTFYASRGPGLAWTGHEARQSIFQHHLAANVHPNLYNLLSNRKMPKVFRNDVYRPDHTYPGQHPVPHLQVINATTHKQHTKLTTEYPLVKIGFNGGGLPGAHQSGPKGPARTLISRVDGIHRFEGVISHDTVDPFNHYLAIWVTFGF